MVDATRNVVRACGEVETNCLIKSNATFKSKDACNQNTDCSIVSFGSYHESTLSAPLLGSSHGCNDLDNHLDNISFSPSTACGVDNYFDNNTDMEMVLPSKHQSFVTKNLFPKTLRSAVCEESNAIIVKLNNSFRMRSPNIHPTILKGAECSIDILTKTVSTSNSAAACISSRPTEESLLLADDEFLHDRPTHDVSSETNTLPRNQMPKMANNTIVEALSDYALKKEFPSVVARIDLFQLDCGVIDTHEITTRVDQKGGRNLTTHECVLCTEEKPLLHEGLEGLTNETTVESYCTDDGRCFENNKTNESCVTDWSEEVSPAVQQLSPNAGEIASSCQSLSAVDDVELFPIGPDSHLNKFPESVNKAANVNQTNFIEGRYNVHNEIVLSDSNTTSIVEQEISTVASTAAACNVRFKSLVQKHSATLRVTGMLLKKRDNNRKMAALKTVRTERKAVKVLGTMFAIFVFCWAPFFTTNLAVGICGFRCQPDDDVFRAFLWLGYVSSTVNPLVYTVFNKTFRKTFKDIVLCRHQRSKAPGAIRQ